MTEDTIFQTIFEYATEKRRDRIEELHKRFGAEFPEKDWNLSGEAWRKNYLCWLIFEKALPETGKTIAEEFAEASTDMGSEMKQNVSQMRNTIRSDFAVISGKDGFLRIKDMNVRTVYEVELPTECPPIPPNTLLTGRIYPFGGHYRFTGVFLAKSTPLILDPDIYMNAFEAGQLSRIESIQLRKGSTFQSVMNKYPSHWIGWMCKHYGIRQRLKKDKIREIEMKLISGIETVVNGLSKQSQDALRLCLAQDGFVKYGMLKGFDDDMSYFWEGKTCESPIMELRQKGLLFVGKMGFGDRNYKIAFVPNELRDGMRSALSSKAAQTSLG